jgi:hypothetical protein
MERREFIKNSSWLTGGFLITDPLNGLTSFANKEKINIGIIGCGDRGKGIMSVMKELKDLFNIVAICDVLPFRMDEAKKVFPGQKLESYSDYRRLLDNKRVHAVVNATKIIPEYEQQINPSFPAFIFFNNCFFTG